MATLLEKWLNFIKERKAKLAANVLALGLAMTPAALQTQAKAAKANAAAKKEVRADKYAKYRSAENEVISQLVFHEGCARKAYKDIVGIWTVGIGNTKRPSGEKVTFRDNLINNSQVRNYVAAHLEREVYPAMNKAISRNLSNREKAAIISLCYNCGTDVLWKGGKKTALAEAINKNDDLYKMVLEERNKLLEEKTNYKISLKFESERYKLFSEELEKLKTESKTLDELESGTLSKEEEKIVEEYNENEKEKNE